MFSASPVFANVINRHHLATRMADSWAFCHANEPGGIKAKSDSIMNVIET